MGGLFSPPSPPAPPPLAALDDGDDEAKRRLDALARRRRGRAGTIATSARGVTMASRSLLSGGAVAQKRKSLLGE